MADRDIEQVADAAAAVYVDKYTGKVSLPVDDNGEVDLDEVPAVIAGLVKLIDLDLDCTMGS